MICHNLGTCEAYISSLNFETLKMNDGIFNEHLGSGSQIDLNANKLTFFISGVAHGPLGCLW